MSKHLINKLKFEFILSDESNFEDLVKEVHEVVRDKLGAIIDEATEDFDLKNNVLLIPRLEINLGLISKLEFKKGLTEKLKSQFASVLKNYSNSAEPKIVSGQELAFFIIDYFIRYGTKPGNLDREVVSFKEVLSKEFDANPRKFLEFIKPYFKNNQFKKRLVDYFPEEILVKAILFQKIKGDFVLVEDFLSVNSFLKNTLDFPNPYRLSLAFKELLLDLWFFPYSFDSIGRFQLAVMEIISQKYGLRFVDAYQNLLNKPTLQYKERSFLNSASAIISSNPKVNKILLIDKFSFFLLNGYNKSEQVGSLYKFSNFNSLFDYLLQNNLEKVIEFLLSQGRNQAVRQRFLETVSQNLLETFFSLVAPSKRKLFQWVSVVFDKVQEEYKPINQTNIRVKKSLNEITFELFLNKNLESISGENYLRLLFKKTAQKYAIGYKELLFLTLKTLSGERGWLDNFSYGEILFKIYNKDILKTKADSKIRSLEHGEKLNEEKTFVPERLTNSNIIALILKQFKFESKEQKQIAVKEITDKLNFYKFKSKKEFLVFWKSVSNKYTNQGNSSKSLFNTVVKNIFGDKVDLGTAHVKEFFDYYLLHKFQFFLNNGFYNTSFSQNLSKYSKIDPLVQYVLINKTEEVIEFLHVNGRSKLVQQRFLKSLSQESIHLFFSLVAPDKSDLFEWVNKVVEVVQIEYKPINQTYIRVKKSIDEITFNLFLNKNLNSITNENYLRLLFKQIAQRHGISYKDLLYYTLKTLNSAGSDFNEGGYSDLLFQIYSKDFLIKSHPIDSSNRNADNNLEFFFNNDFVSVKNIQEYFLKNINSIFKGKSSDELKRFKAQLSSIHFESVSEFLSLWENFYLRSESSNLDPLILTLFYSSKEILSKDQFEFWRKKFEIKGLSYNRRTRPHDFFAYLINNRSLISISSLKFLLRDISWDNSIIKVDFYELSEFIFPNKSSDIKKLISLVDNSLILYHLESKKVVVYQWLYNLFFSLKVEEITPLDLLNRFNEFLSFRFKVSWDVVEQPLDFMDSQGSKPLPSSAFSGTMYKDTNSSVSYFLDVLGRNEIIKFFPEFARYDDQFVIKLLFSRYKVEFYKLFYKNRLNNEFIEFILIQSPPWLKKEIGDFLLESYNETWFSLIHSIRFYFEKLKWFKIKGKSLDPYIEMIVFSHIMKKSDFSILNLQLEILESGFNDHLLSKEFFQDFKSFSSLEVFNSGNFSHGIQELVKLSRTVNLNYFSFKILSKYEQDNFFNSLIYDIYYRNSEDVDKLVSILNQKVTSDMKSFFNFLSNSSVTHISHLAISFLDLKILKKFVSWVLKYHSYKIEINLIETIISLLISNKKWNKKDFYEKLAIFLTSNISSGMEETIFIKELFLFLLKFNSFSQSKVINYSYSELVHVFHSKFDKVIISKLNLEESLIQFNKVNLEFYQFELEDFGKLINDNKLSFLNVLWKNKFVFSWVNLFWSESDFDDRRKFRDMFIRIFYFGNFSMEIKIRDFIISVFALPKSNRFFESAKLKHGLDYKAFLIQYPFFNEKILLDSSLKISMSPPQQLNFFLEKGIIFGNEIIRDKFFNLIEENTKDFLKEYQSIIFSHISNKQNPNLLILFEKLDLIWMLNLIHPNLDKDFNEVLIYFQKNYKINLLRDLSLYKNLDIIYFISELWLKLNSHINNSYSFLIIFIEFWVIKTEVQTVQEIFSEPQNDIIILIKNSSPVIKRILQDGDIKDEEEKADLVQRVVQDEVDYSEGVTINNAGIILCWPFFGRFFSSLNMVENGKFKNKFLEERAVQLLQFISTGNKEMQEWDLTLNKVLCGVSPDFPVSNFIDINPDEEELCQKLINGTIYNWEKMRGTSLETFRETFILRNGILYEKENRWELVVEKKAYDVLLDTLNWNISMISLSWMNKRLNVTWK